MKKPSGNTDVVEPSRFASDVIEAYKAVMAGKPRRPELDREVRKVAYGLAALRQVTDHYYEKFKNDPDIKRLPSSGFVDAAAILDALTSGADHPIWRHIDGLKSAAYRPGRAPKSKTERLRQSIAGGLVLALQEAGKPSARKAAEAIVSEIRSPDFSFTSEQLRKWAKHDDARDHAERFIQTARTIPNTKNLYEAVILAGRTEVFRFWSAPY